MIVLESERATFVQNVSGQTFFAAEPRNEEMSGGFTRSEVAESQRHFI